jgi:ribosomal protein L37E
MRCPSCSAEIPPALVLSERQRQIAARPHPKAMGRKAWNVKPVLCAKCGLTLSTRQFKRSPKCPHQRKKEGSK